MNSMILNKKFQKIAFIFISLLFFLNSYSSRNDVKFDLKLSTLKMTNGDIVLIKDSRNQLPQYNYFSQSSFPQKSAYSPAAKKHFNVYARQALDEELQINGEMSIVPIKSVLKTHNSQNSEEFYVRGSVMDSNFCLYKIKLPDRCQYNQVDDAAGKCFDVDFMEKNVEYEGDLHISTNISVKLGKKHSIINFNYAYISFRNAQNNNSDSLVVLNDEQYDILQNCQPSDIFNIDQCIDSDFDQGFDFYQALSGVKNNALNVIRMHEREDSNFSLLHFQKATNDILKILNCGIHKTFYNNQCEEIVMELLMSIERINDNTILGSFTFNYDSYRNNTTGISNNRHLKVRKNFDCVYNFGYYEISKKCLPLLNVNKYIESKNRVLPAISLLHRSVNLMHFNEGKIEIDSHARNVSVLTAHSDSVRITDNAECSKKDFFVVDDDDDDNECKRLLGVRKYMIMDSFIEAYNPTRNYSNMAFRNGVISDTLLDDYLLLTKNDNINNYHIDRHLQGENPYKIESKERLIILGFVNEQNRELKVFTKISKNNSEVLELKYLEERQKILDMTQCSLDLALDSENRNCLPIEFEFEATSGESENGHNEVVLVKHLQIVDIDRLANVDLMRFDPKCGNLCRNARNNSKLKVEFSHNEDLDLDNFATNAFIHISFDENSNPKPILMEISIKPFFFSYKKAHQLLARKCELYQSLDENEECIDNNFIEVVRTRQLGTEIVPSKDLKKFIVTSMIDNLICFTDDINDKNTDRKANLITLMRPLGFLTDSIIDDEMHQLCSIIDFENSESDICDSAIGTFVKKVKLIRNNEDNSDDKKKSSKEILVIVEKNYSDYMILSKNNYLQLIASCQIGQYYDNSSLNCIDVVFIMDFRSENSNENNVEIFTDLPLNYAMIRKEAYCSSNYAKVLMSDNSYKCLPYAIDYFDRELYDNNESDAEYFMQKNDPTNYNSKYELAFIYKDVMILDNFNVKILNSVYDVYTYLDFANFIHIHYINDEDAIIGNISLINKPCSPNHARIGDECKKITFVEFSSNSDRIRFMMKPTNYGMINSICRAGFEISRDDAFEEENCTITIHDSTKDPISVELKKKKELQDNYHIEDDNSIIFWAFTVTLSFIASASIISNILACYMLC